MRVCTQQPAISWEPTVLPAVSGKLHAVNYSHPETIGEDSGDWEAIPSDLPTWRKYLWGLQGPGVCAQRPTIIQKSTVKPIEAGKLCLVTHTHSETIGEVPGGWEAACSNVQLSRNPPWILQELGVCIQKQAHSSELSLRPTGTSNPCPVTHSYLGKRNETCRDWEILLSDSSTPK